jgi:hypothetical protein
MLKHFIYDEVDLIWLWSGWGASIIIYSMIHVRNQKPSELPTTATATVRQQISGWSCILMTPSHNRRCWNTLYMYKVDLIWVWSGWVVLIITYSTLQVRNRVNRLRLPLWLWLSSKYQVGVTFLWPMTPSHSSRYENTLYMYGVNMPWVRSVWGVLIIIITYNCYSYNLQHKVRNQVNLQLPSIY